MTGHIFYTAGQTGALGYAVKALNAKGIVFADKPSGGVTHLLLGIPSFDPDGSLKGGGSFEDALTHLNKDVTIIGGNLPAERIGGYKSLDLLRDPVYLAENADITAHCAVRQAVMRLPITLKGCHILVIGWGRIGKCLARLLKQMGAYVTVAARKEADRAMVMALGYDALDAATLGYALMRYRVIFNTVPVTVITKEAAGYCRDDCLKIDLASIKGMDAEDAVWARGLPNLDAPESSGELIARTVLRLI